MCIIWKTCIGPKKRGKKTQSHHRITEQTNNSLYSCSMLIISYILYGSNLHHIFSERFFCSSRNLHFPSRIGCFSYNSNALHSVRVCFVLVLWVFLYSNHSNAQLKLKLQREKKRTRTNNTNHCNGSNLLKSFRLRKGNKKNACGQMPIHSFKPFLCMN